MKKKSILKILFVEDLQSDLELEVLELRKEKIIFEYISVCTSEDLERALVEFNPDLIISDYMMPSFNGLQALKLSKKLKPEVPFILCTGSVNEEIAVECIKAGAVDYVIKEHLSRLPFVVKEAIEQLALQKEKNAYELLVKESDEKLKSIFISAPVGIGLVVNRVLVEVNDTLCKMVGYTRKDLIGKSSELLYPNREEYEFVGKEKYRQISEFGTGSVETLFKCKDGAILNVILSSTPLDRLDLSKGVTFTVLDISDRKKAEEALRLSEEKFRSIAENLSDIIFITDERGIIQYVSPSSKMFGYSQIELTGTFFGDYLADGEVEKGMEHFYNALNSINNSDIITLTFKRKDRSMFVADLSGSSYISENGSTGVLGLIRDVTDKMNREIELRKLSRAVEQNPVSIVITNTEGIIEYVNNKMCEVTGYDRNELLGNNPSVLSSREKSNEDYKNLWDTIKAGNDWKGVFHNRRKNGELYWESASISPIKNDKGEITHFLGIKEDITQNKILQELTIESEKRYRELFLNNPVPTYIFDEKTLEFVEVNEATVEYYGYSREEFSQMTLKDLRTEEDMPDLLKSIEGLGKDIFHSVKMRHRKKNGHVFPVEITSHSLPEKNGRRTRLVMAKDITETVEAARQMELARKKAEAGDRLKTTFLNNISHEVRTPLNGIIGFAEIMSDPNLTDEVKKESISILYESSNRLIDTITNYMDISLLTSASLNPIYKEFCPGEILKAIYERNLQECLLRKLEFKTDLPPDYKKESIVSDPEIFRKIVSHLISNAIKFTDSGIIKFGYKLFEGELEVFVKDTGIGIERESLERIFDRFVKEDQNQTRFSEGSGLGLAIVRGMVEILGGKVSVDSTPGAGSCFSFRIPLQKGPKTGIITHKMSTGKDSGDVPCIMIAEDDETNYFFMNALIKKEIGARILHATNGREAVELFKANIDLDLILMDIKMPFLDGIEATKQIKQINKDIPVIAITAYAMAGDESRILAAGCDNYLSKPINKKNLLEIITKYLLVKKGR